MFFGEESKKNDKNQDYSPSNINVNHSAINIHNNYFVNNNDTDQAIIESSIPSVSVNGFIVPLTNGPTNIEAKNTWPMSREISDRVLNLTKEKENAIYFNNNNL